MRILIISVILFYPACLAQPLYVNNKPVYRPLLVTPEYLEVFQEIARGAEDAAGYEVIGSSQGLSGKIEMNEFLVEAQDSKNNSNEGHYDPDSPSPHIKAYTIDRDIIMPDIRRIDERQRAGVLAHEIGHAMGLAHADHGLMYPYLMGDCLKREGACLVEALREGGLLK